MNTLDQLWQHAESVGSLNPALVDYTADEAGEPEFGEFLMWAWRADRWPSIDAPYCWLVYPQDPFYVWSCWSRTIGKPFNLPMKRMGANGDNSFWTRSFKTACAAFEFLFSAWQKLDAETKQQLFDMVK